MNKRIRELAEEAGFGIAGNPEYVHAMDYDGMCTDELEKFAELIVKECAGIYDKIDNGNLHIGTDDYLEALHKTFFGVES